MIKYRPHRGSLAESLKEQTTVESIKELKAEINKIWPYQIEAIDFRYVGNDERINWDSYLVVAKFEDHKKHFNTKTAIPVGYSDGKLDEPKKQ